MPKVDLNEKNIWTWTQFPNTHFNVRFTTIESKTSSWHQSI